MMQLEVRQLDKEFAVHRKASVRALESITFQVGGGEFVSLLGPSGCGKTTLLQLIAGLEEATGGEILLDDERVTGPGKDRGMVFQNYTLYPWLTVRQNARFSFRLRSNRKGHALDDVVARTDSLLDLMGLRAFVDALPRELSGGMKQRVAIVRALANRPKVLLMDEPFGALDAQTREEMQELMQLLHAHEQTTILFVTHDVEEAIYLSTRILVFSARPGRIIDDVPVPFSAAERTPELKLSLPFMELKRKLIRLLHPGARPGIDRQALLKSLVQHPNHPNRKTTP
jgi:ABC-type nitrate/sulfonate/bicarbonate transport system ATPase subunit